MLETGISSSPMHHNWLAHRLYLTYIVLYIYLFPRTIYQLTDILHNLNLFSLVHLLYIWQPSMATLRQQKCCFGLGSAEMPGQRLAMIRYINFCRTFLHVSTIPQNSNLSVEPVVYSLFGSLVISERNLSYRS